jgi:histidyl-tRNA synthetase
VNNSDNKVLRLNNFEDFGPSRLRLLKHIENNCLKYLINAGYSNVDPPILESADLFLKKSLGNTSSSTYTFMDLENQLVSMRPDFTASVIRLIFDNFKKRDFMSKVCYSGPVFRYEPAISKSMQIYQVGAEFLGQKGSKSDLELLSNSIKCLDLSGVKNYKIDLGNVGIVREFIFEKGFGNSIAELILNNLENFNDKDWEENLIFKANQLNLIRSNKKENNSLSHEDILNDYEDRLSLNLGMRTQKDIINRFAGKVASQVTMEEIKECINLVKKIMNMTTEEFLNNKKGIKLDSKNCQEFRILLENVQNILGAKRSLSLNFTLTRNLAYYNGIVFDVKSNEGIILGGGGRYDDLPSRLGYDFEEGCLGFAINLTKTTQAIGY